MKLDPDRVALAAMILSLALLSFIAGYAVREYRVFPDPALRSAFRASEALFFVRLLEGDVPAGASARVQISPDGIRWCDEGTELQLPASPDELTFARVREFGGWLRLSGTLPPGTRLTTIVYAVLKE